MKVKLLKVYYSGEYDNQDYYWINDSKVHDQTEWEEISQEDYELLKKAVNKKNKSLYQYGEPIDQYYIATEKPEPIRLLISNFIEEVKIEEAAESERKKKYEAAAKKRSETMKAKAEERKRQQLEKLKRELGDV